VRDAVAYVEARLQPLNGWLATLGAEIRFDGPEGELVEPSSGHPDAMTEEERAHLEQEQVEIEEARLIHQLWLLQPTRTRWDSLVVLSIGNEVTTCSPIEVSSAWPMLETITYVEIDKALDAVVGRILLDDAFERARAASTPIGSPVLQASDE